MKNMYLLSALFTGTLICSSAFAGDYSVTVDQLNSASDHFVFNEITDMAGKTEAQAPSWDNTGTFEIVNYDTILPPRIFGYTYTAPDGYERFIGTTYDDYAPLENNVTFYDSEFTMPPYSASYDITGDFIDSAFIVNGIKTNITGNFVGNNTVLRNINQGSDQISSLGNINANFIGTQGILNGVTDDKRNHGYVAEIKSINSKLVAGNSHGFLVNYNGTVGDINVETAINNVGFTDGDDKAMGGYITNRGIIDFYYMPQYEYVVPTPKKAAAAETYIGSNDGRISNPEKYSAQIGNITGDIIGNMALGYESAGGAIVNSFGQIGDISADFLGNSARFFDPRSVIEQIDNPEIERPREIVTPSSRQYGGAIANGNGKIGTITGNFKDNFAEGPDIAGGGAIYNSIYLQGFTQPIVQGYPYAGPSIRDAETKNAIGLDDVYAERMNIEGSTFDGNYAHSTEDNAYGGAIYNDFRFSNQISESPAYLDDEEGYLQQGYVYMTDDELQQKVIDAKANAALTLTNANFINNHADSDNGQAFGGAIYSTGDVNVIAKDGKTSLFSGNTANGESNAIYMTASTSEIQYEDPYYEEQKDVDPLLPSNLNLTAVNDGVIQFDDAIDGDGYNINVSGDGTGVVKFNNLVKNVTNFTLGANSITHLGLNSKVYAQNMNIDGSAIIHTSAASSPIITVDVEVDKDNNTIHTGQIFVDNDIDGSYRVLVNSLNPDVLDNTEDAVVPFLFAPNDDTDTSSSFAVARVIGSPYMWDGKVNARDETEGSTWYLNLTDDENPEYNPDDPQPQPKPGKIYAPEVVAGIGLHEAAIEQTRSVVHNIKGKVAAGREFCPRCGMYDYGWDNNLLRNVWVLAQGESANIEEPVDMEAKIYAVEGGFDIQNDIHNTLGVFASYRTGEYDLSGKGKKFRSNLGSEIDIDSYLAGLYYRYDRYLVWAFATIYGGVQQADVKTDDGMAKFDTDGIEFGASIEVGRTIPLAKDLMLDPSVGLYYTQVNFDDADDNVGKHYEWDDIKHLEAELGAKLEKQFDNAKVYVKPSVIRTFTNGDSVTISGMDKAGTYSDQTLGRIEIGGRYGFTDALSGYAWANYTFGSSYDAYALGAGMSYAW